jgi:hypothetical protein
MLWSSVQVVPVFVQHSVSLKQVSRYVSRHSPVTQIEPASPAARFTTTR